MNANRFTDFTPLHYIVGALFLLALVLVFAHAWWIARKERIASGRSRWALADEWHWFNWKRLYVEDLTRFGVAEIDAKSMAQAHRFDYHKSIHLAAAKEDYERERGEPIR